MAANKKQNQLRAAKDRRTKKLAIVGAVLLVAILAFQVPRTMKMLGGPETEAAPAVGAPADVSVPAAEAVPVAQPVTLANAEAAPEPDAGQLVALGRFDTKDPFAQQVSDSDAVASGGTYPGTQPSQTAPSRPSAPSRLSVVSTPSGLPSRVSTQVPSSVGTSAGQPSAGAPSTAPATPGSAVIAVNGVEHTVAVKSEFPQDDPTFRLVALTATSAKIGIAGGTLASGAGTLTLRAGKTVTLMNTIDGTRYEIQLRSAA